MTGRSKRSTLSIVGLVLSCSSCTEAPTSLPPTAPTTLEANELLSGDRGVLVSEAFSSIDLEAAQDSLGEPVEHRWLNFAVLFEGDTVDSWRVDPERIAFRVPVLTTGDYSLRVASPVYSAAPLGARVLGLVSTSYLDDCGWIGPDEVVPISPEEALFFTWCNRYQEVVGNIEGTALIRPALLRSGFRWLEGAHLENTGEGFFRSYMFAAGPSYRPGYAVLEHPVLEPPDSITQTWVWRFGREPTPVSEIECFPAPDAGSLYTAAEVAPGVCVALGQYGRLFRNGEQLAYTFFGANQHTTFRVSSQGVAAPTTSVGTLFRSEWPVIVDEGIGIYTVPEYRDVSGVAFSPSGDSLFVAADISDRSEDYRNDTWVLDIRESTTGVLWKRERLDTCVADLAYAHDKLWLLGCGSTDDIMRVEIRSTDLTELRAVERYTEWYPYRFLMPASDGRRAYLFGTHSRALWMAIVDVF